MSNTKKLSTCAVLVAMATALAIISMVLPLRLPFGGSVTFASMLPIVICAYMFGGFRISAFTAPLIIKFGSVSILSHDTTFFKYFL